MIVRNLLTNQDHEARLGTVLEDSSSSRVVVTLVESGAILDPRRWRVVQASEQELLELPDEWDLLEV